MTNDNKNLTMVPINYDSLMVHCTDSLTVRLP